jgi:Uma2 family endonuclease
MNIHVPAHDFIRTTRAAEGLERWRWTTAELLRLVELGVFDEDDRFELIGGEIVPMSPKGRQHEVVADELARFWGPKVTPDIWVSVEKQFNLDPYTYTDPDIVVRPANIKSYDLRGDTALLVVESADSSLGKDLGVKARVYATFGVREYWVINARDKSTRVHRSPKGDAYTDIVDVPATDLLEPLLAPQLAVRLADLDLA